MSSIIGYMCHNPHQRTVSVLLAAASPLVVFAVSNNHDLHMQ